MKPYNEKFLLEKINEYNNKIKEIKVGTHEICRARNTNDKLVGYGYEKENISKLETLKLTGSEKIWMKLDEREIEGSYFIIKKAHGRVGIVGLGLGYSAIEIAKRKNVKEVVVYESEQDVIDMFYENFGKQRKIKIIKGDAFKAKSEVFDYFFVDIYEYELSTKIPKDYVKFKKLHKIKDYVFFGVEEFLLSSRYEEIIWVFIPEIWMDMSKKMYVALQEANYMKYVKQLDEDVVSKVLAEFKIILDKEE